MSDTSLEELERVHLSFLRRILDVPRATAAKHLYAETGRLPHKTFWWQQSLKYMHHLTSVDSSQIVHKAFTADLMQELGWGQAVKALCKIWDESTEVRWCYTHLLYIVVFSQLPSTASEHMDDQALCCQ